MRSWNLYAFAGVMMLAGAGLAPADDPIEQVERRLIEARAGTMRGIAYINPWELPAKARRAFKAPVLMGWVFGENGYVVSATRGQIRVGEQLGGYEVLAIRKEGVVVQAGEYAVLVR